MFICTLGRPGASNVCGMQAIDAQISIMASVTRAFVCMWPSHLWHTYSSEHMVPTSRRWRGG